MERVGEEKVVHKLSARDSGRLQYLQSGSLYIGKRAQHAGLTDTAGCELCASPQPCNARHAYWECSHPEVKRIRDGFLPGISKCVNQNSSCNLFEHNPFMHCGIVPEDENLLRARNDLQSVVLEPQNVQSYNEVASDKEWWEDGFRRVFSDSGVAVPDDRRFSRMVAANYYGQDHSENIVVDMSKSSSNKGLHVRWLHKNFSMFPNTFIFGLSEIL